MIPSERLVAAAVLATLWAGLCAWAWEALWPLLAFDAGVVALALLDGWRNVGEVSARREHVPVVGVARPCAVSLRVHNRGSRALDLWVNDGVAGSVDGLPARFVLAAGEETALRYEVRFNERGRYTFGAVTVRWRSPWGLWWRQQQLAVDGEIKVFPDFSFLREGAGRGVDSAQRAPVRARRNPGGESEFQRLRRYVPGDPYRHVDWKATARRQHLVAREFGQESNQNVIFLLDAGRMMSARSGELSMFDHALNAALALGHAALARGDRVGVLAFDRSVRAWLPPRGGARNGHRLIHGTFDLSPSLEEPDFAAAFRFLSAEVRQRSLVVLLTTVIDEVNAEQASAVSRALGSRHLPVCVWLRDVELDAMIDAPPEDRADLCARGAAAELLAWRERSLDALRRRGVRVIDCAPQALSDALLGRYLEIKALRLL